LAQACDDWECIVVDDGSTDATWSILGSFAAREPRIRGIQQRNQGPGGAYNTGVSSAVGDFIVLCSADDVLLNEHLARMASFIEAEPGYDIYSTNGYFWWPGDAQEPFYVPGEMDRVCSLELGNVVHRCFYSVGAAYRRDWFTKIGGYRVGVYGEDYDFWLRAMASGARHRYLPELLSLHRVSRTQRSANLERSFRSDIQLLTDLRSAFELSPENLQEIDAAISERERLIAGVGSPRARVERSLVRLLGRRRGHRLMAAFGHLVRSLRLRRARD